MPTLYNQYRKYIRTPKESRRAGTAEYVTNNHRSISGYSPPQKQKNILSVSSNRQIDKFTN